MGGGSARGRPRPPRMAAAAPARGVPGGAGRFQLQAAAFDYANDSEERRDDGDIHGQGNIVDLLMAVLASVPRNLFQQAVDLG